MHTSSCVFVAMAVVICVADLPGVVPQSPSMGKCPKVTTQKKLDIKQYLGTWYQIEAFPNWFQKGECAKAVYSLKPDGHIKVVNSEIVDGKVNQITGDAYRPDDKEQGKLKVRFFDLAPYGDYWVIDTDYKNYTLVYSCMDVAKIFKLTFAWVLAREPKLDVTTVVRLESELKSFGVDITPFRRQDPKKCHY